ncbi:biopolymer transporter ExbD [Novosphingobium sp. MW5]|nr:biopolymer transporter ExbD [Novosphingobium sp. MW5]
MATATEVTRNRPMADLNTTPLIDVLLVLLILFIITIPPATHEIEMDLPAPGKSLPTIRPEVNLLSVTANGAIVWNGEAVSEGELVAVLQRVAETRPAPEVRFTPESAAPYGVTARVLRNIRASGVLGFGFVGTEQYAGFGKQAGR